MKWCVLDRGERGFGEGGCLTSECIMRLCGWVCEKLSVCMFRSGYAWVCFMQGGAGAKPDPCVFYLHLNEARGDLPFCCSHSLFLCLSLSLSVSPVDIDLFAKQGDRQCFQLFQSLCFPFHLYLGKALTPHVAAMLWPSAHGPHFPCIKPCLHVCVSACLFELESGHACRRFVSTCFWPCA